MRHDIMVHCSRQSCVCQFRVFQLCHLSFFVSYASVSYISCAHVSYLLVAPASGVCQLFVSCAHCARVAVLMGVGRLGIEAYVVIRQFIDPAKNVPAFVPARRVSVSKPVKEELAGKRLDDWLEDDGFLPQEIISNSGILLFTIRISSLNSLIIRSCTLGRPT